MIDIAIDSSGNITLDSFGEIKTVSLGSEVAQAVRTALQAWFGEYFLNKRFGIDYLEKIFKKPFKPSRIDREIRRVLRDVDGISAITLIDLSLNDLDEITGTIDLITIYGQETIVI